MRYVHANNNAGSSGNSQALFCEQVHHLTALFENWNDCEKTVVLYALLRRLPFPNLKFLQMSIDYNLNFAQTLNSQTKLNFIEDNANSIAFLNKLVHKYTNLTTSSSSNNNSNKKSDKNDTATSSSSNCSATTASIANDSGINNSAVNINDSANKSIENDLDLMGKYSSKEDIIMDLLVYLPLMKPGNDDVKKIYIQLIPIMLEDSIRQIIPVELVQQALSYLLIHPAINNDDRKNLSQWLRHLEEHIAFTYIQQTKGISPNNYPNLPQDNVSSFMSTASTSSSSSSSSSASSTSSSTWQTVQPPNPISTVNANGSNTSNNTTNKAASMTMPPPPPQTTPIQPAPSNGWDYQNIQINQEFCDDLNLNQTRFPKPIGNIGNKNSNSSQSSLNSSKNNTHSNSSSIIFENDDHHVSFSKNGTEIIDYDQVDDFMGGPQSDGGGTNDLTSNTTGPKKITKKYRDASNNVIATVTLTDFLHVPTTSMFNDHLFDSMGIYDNSSDDCNAIKTRRSNSLTTPTASGQLCSSSAENLTNLQQKPRSFSLSMESSRNALISSGSDTRLDDFNKMNGMKLNGNPHHSGMSHIGQWLKSLRLHKYFWLFSNMSYEQMMEMSEEYLENLGVTKGARHKLVLCIQKLAERMKILYQIERELMDGSRCLKSGLDELTQIVMTPMKPVNSVPRDEDVALQFLKVLECAFQVLVNIKYLTQQDEEAVNVFLWVIDKTLHNDAFLQQFNHLKEYKFKLSKAKMTFAPKSHYNKSQPNLGGNNKMRWNPNGKLHKTGNNQNINSSNSNISSSSDNPAKNHRKGSMQAFQMYNNYNNGNHNANKNSKSSSYPNFVTSNQHQMTNNQRSSSRDKLHVLIQQQQQQQMQTKKQPPPPPPQQAQIMGSQMNPNAAPYHRHSLNNLMNQQTLLQMQQLQQPQNNCGSLGGSLKSLSSNSSSNHGDGGTINTTSYASSLVGNSTNNSCNNSNNNQISNNSNNLLMMSHKHGGQGQVAGSIGDINSRLESLCLQMTEQAIN